MKHESNGDGKSNAQSPKSNVEGGDGDKSKVQGPSVQTPSVQAPISGAVSEGEPDERISTDWLIRKVRDNSTWNQLLPAERERLDGWLFDENLGYAKTVARIKSEFGIDTTVPSVARYYQRRARERQAEELVEAQLAADGLNSLNVDAKSLRTAVLKLVGKAALRVASEKPEEIEQLASLAQVLLEAEQNDLRRGRLEFAQRCFDYDATVESLHDMPRFRAYMQAIMDDNSLNGDEKIKKVHAVMFHWASAVKSGRVR